MKKINLSLSIILIWNVFLVLAMIAVVFGVNYFYGHWYGLAALVGLYYIVPFNPSECSRCAYLYDGRELLEEAAFVLEHSEHPHYKKPGDLIRRIEHHLDN